MRVSQINIHQSAISEGESISLSGLYKINLFLLISIALIFFFPNCAIGEEGKIPNPRVSVNVNTPTPTTTSATFLNGQFASKDDIMEGSISLTNFGENVDEASGGGIFVQLDGAEFIEVYDYISDFDEAVGYTKDAQQIDIDGATIVELYTDNLYPTESTGSAKFKLRVTSESGYVNISFRGWLFDPDDETQNPETSLNGQWITRYPHDFPDGRFDGQDFTKYRTFIYNVYPNYLQQIIEQYTTPSDTCYSIDRAYDINNSFYFILYRINASNATPNGILIVNDRSRSPVSDNEVKFYSLGMAVLLEDYQHDLASFQEEANYKLKLSWALHKYAKSEAEALETEIWSTYWTQVIWSSVNAVLCGFASTISAPTPFALVVIPYCTVSGLISWAKVMTKKERIELFNNELIPNLEAIAKYAKIDEVEVELAASAQYASSAWSAISSISTHLDLLDSYITYLNSLKKIAEVAAAGDPEAQIEVNALDLMISENNTAKEDLLQQQEEWAIRLSDYRELVRYPNQGIQTYPTDLIFSSNEQGESPPSQTLNIQNTGSGSINWRISDKPSWIDIDKVNGNTPEEVEVSVDVSGLSAGTHLGQIEITSTSDFVSPISLDVAFYYIEPTIFKPDPQADTDVWGTHPDDNFGQSSTLKVGGPYGDFGGGAYAFVKFPVGDIIGKKIASAKLRMYLSKTGSNSVRIQACRMPDNWVESGEDGLIYNDGTGQGSDPFDGEGSGDTITIRTNDEGEWVEWDVGELVRDWAQRGEPNNGFYLRPVDFNGSYIYFHSRDYPNPPELIVELCEGDPDLVISKIQPKLEGEYISPPFYVGQEIYFKTTILNSGSGCVDKTFYLRYYLEDNVTSLNNQFDFESCNKFFTPGGSVPQGEYYTFTEDDIDKIGSSYVNILVDANDNVTESDENNNIGSYGPFKVLPEKDFKIEIAPSNISIKQGNEDHFTITINPISDFNSSVTLSATVPTGMDYIFSSDQISPSEYSILHLSASTGISPGKYTITIEGEGGGKHNSTIVEVEVLDGIEPTVTITSPTSESYYETNTTPIIISGVASDQNLSIITISTGDTNNGTFENWGFTVDLTEGDNLIVITAIDEAGNEGTGAIVINYIPLEPDISVAPPSHDFEDVPVGSSFEQVFTVLNDGNDTLHVSSSIIVGDNPDDFSIVDGEGSFNIEPENNHNITVRFSPTSAGNRNAILRISSDDPDENPLDIDLLGTGTGPEINVKQGETGIPDNTGSYDFGNVVMGSSKAVTFTIENLGSEDLDLTGTPIVQTNGVNADDFVVTQQTSTPVPAGESVMFEITFTPVEEGIRSANVSIDNNDSDENPYNFELLGQGVSEYIYLITPNGGGIYSAGDQVDISWESNGTGIDKIRLRLSPDGGTNYDGYSYIVSHTDNDEIFFWTVPDLATTQARIKVEALDSNGDVIYEDESDEDFTILSPDSLNAVKNGHFSCGLIGWKFEDVSTTYHGCANAGKYAYAEAEVVDGMARIHGYSAYGEGWLKQSFAEIRPTMVKFYYRVGKDPSGHDAGCCRANFILYDDDEVLFDYTATNDSGSIYQGTAVTFIGESHQIREGSSIIEGNVKVVFDHSIGKVQVWVNEILETTFDLPLGTIIKANQVALRGTLSCCDGRDDVYAYFDDIVVGGKALIVENLPVSVNSHLTSYGLKIDSSPTIPANMEEYTLVLVNSYAACDPTTAGYIENYINSGGGVVLHGGTPAEFTAPSGSHTDDLSTIRHWFGASHYSNAGGPAEVIFNNPLGTTLSAGDLLDYCPESTPWAARVDDPNPETNVLAEWTNYTGYIYAHIYPYELGQLLYWAGWPIYNDNSLELFDAGLRCLLTGGIDEKGDINGDGVVDLADAILALQVLCGMNPKGVNNKAGVNGGGKIGLQEAIYILQKVSEVRD